MLKTTARMRRLEENRVMLETLTSIERASADPSLIDHATDAALLLG